MKHTKQSAESVRNPMLMRPAEMRRTPLFLQLCALRGYALDSVDATALLRQLEIVSDHGVSIDWERLSVRSAFSWRGTPQGFEYWQDYHTTTLNYYEYRIGAIYNPADAEPPAEPEAAQ